MKDNNLEREFIWVSVYTDLITKGGLNNEEATMVTDITMECLENEDVETPLAEKIFNKVMERILKKEENRLIEIESGFNPNHN